MDAVHGGVVDAAGVPGADAVFGDYVRHRSVARPRERLRLRSEPRGETDLTVGMRFVRIDPSVGLSAVMAKHAPQETRRAQILGAAITCFADKGYYGTSIDDIAALTHLSKGAIYHHFESKREILLALFEEWSADLLARWRSIGEQSAPLEALGRDAQEALNLAEDIVPLSRATLEFCSHAVREDDLRQRVAGVYGDARGYLTGLIEEARRQGLVGDVSAPLMATVLIAMFEGLFLLKAIDPETVDVGATWQEGTSALLIGLTSSATVEVRRP